MTLSKVELLNCSERAAEFINNQQSGKYITLISDIIEVAKEKKEEKIEQKKIFLKLLYNAKNTNVHGLLGGGETIKYSFLDFVNKYLKIKKTNDGIVIQNPDFKELDIDELDYVFAWGARLINNEKENDKKKKKHKGKHRENNDYKQYMKKHNQGINKGLEKLKDFFDD